ncbi:heat stress transcription factor A-5, partial [Tanacetum coccineum]
TFIVENQFTVTVLLKLQQLIPKEQLLRKKLKTREKTSLEKNLIRYKQQQPASELQLEDPAQTQRVNSMEQRQDALRIFLKKAAQNPDFVENLAQKLESMDFSADNKTRRLPKSRIIQRLHKNYRGDTWQAARAFGYMHSFNLGSSLTHKTGPTLDTDEETEGHPSCQLNLTLASSVSQINPCQDTDTIPQSFDDIGKPPSENVTSNPRPTNNATPAAPTAVPTRVNDVFWEQILTERPGSSDVDDTSSDINSTTPSNEQDDRRSGHGSYGNSSNLQNLTLWVESPGSSHFLETPMC